MTKKRKTERRDMTFGDSIYDNLPYPLNKFAERYADHKPTRDYMLVGALAAMAVQLHRVEIDFNGDTIYPPFYFLVCSSDGDLFIRPCPRFAGEKIINGFDTGGLYKYAHEAGARLAWMDYFRHNVLEHKNGGNVNWGNIFLHKPVSAQGVKVAKPIIGLLSYESPDRIMDDIAIDNKLTKKLFPYLAIYFANATILDMENHGVHFYANVLFGHREYRDVESDTNENFVANFLARVDKLYKAKSIKMGYSDDPADKEYLSKQIEEVLMKGVENDTFDEMEEAIDKKLAEMEKAPAKRCETVIDDTAKGQLTLTMILQARILAVIATLRYMDTHDEDVTDKDIVIEATGEDIIRAMKIALGLQAHKQIVYPVKQ